jgi:hypothetical protein
VIKVFAKTQSVKLNRPQVDLEAEKEKEENKISMAEA